MDFNALAQQFLTQYFQVFDNSRKDIVNFYEDVSVLTVESRTYAGRAQILEKVQSYNFGSISREFTSFDAQPTPGGGVLIFLTGRMAINGQMDKPIMFSHVFHLMPSGGGRFYIHNEMYRFNFQ